MFNSAHFGHCHRYENNLGHDTALGASETAPDRAAWKYTLKHLVEGQISVLAESTENGAPFSHPALWAVPEGGASMRPEHFKLLLQPHLPTGAVDCSNLKSLFSETIRN
jgi:hypothetical protein